VSPATSSAVEAPGDRTERRCETNVSRFAVERRGVNAGDDMSAADFRSLKRSRVLITPGQQVGVLTHAEVATAAAELGLDETDLEELHGWPPTVASLTHRAGRPLARGPSDRA
jgi:hypothetical protein